MKVASDLGDLEIVMRWWTALVVTIRFMSLDARWPGAEDGRGAELVGSSERKSREWAGLGAFLGGGGAESMTGSRFAGDVDPLGWAPVMTTRHIFLAIG